MDSTVARHKKEFCVSEKRSKNNVTGPYFHRSIDVERASLVPHSPWREQLNTPLSECFVFEQVGRLKTSPHFNQRVGHPLQTLIFR